MHWPPLREAGDRLAVGTVESYLVYRLTGGAHVSDASNASRTLLMDLGGNGRWDDGLCDLLGVPMDLLPEITDNTTTMGTTEPTLFGSAIPIHGMTGVQPAASVGKGSLSAGTHNAASAHEYFPLHPSGTTRPNTAT